MATLVEVKNLKKYFKTPRGYLHAVDDISFKIEQGTTLGVVGESGCGKSTLGRTVIRLLDRTSGEIYFEGKDISDVKGAQLKALREDMQMIFQDPFSSLNPRMSVSQLIAEPLLIYKKCANKEELNNQIAKLMDTVGLALRLADDYPHELDGGRRQRIGVARALALSPKFIVCDEPVSALDVSIQAQIINLMQDLQEEHGLTYMFITHDMSVVRHVSDDILVMYLGSMVEFADSEEMFQRQLHPYTQALLAAVPIPIIVANKERILIKGEITSPINLGNECRFAKRCPFVKEKCLHEIPPLLEAVPGHFVACHYVKEINHL